MGKTSKNQSDLVRENTDRKLPQVTEKVFLPGIQYLHTKPIEEIANALAAVLKSRQNIKSLTYKLGEYIEITSDSDSTI